MLDRIILRQDLYATLRRFDLTHDDTEITELTVDQLRDSLIISRAQPGDAVTAEVEELIKQKTPT